VKTTRVLAAAAAAAALAITGTACGSGNHAADIRDCKSAIQADIGKALGGQTAFPTPPACKRLSKAEQGKLARQIMNGS
jgi:hypothetical protein